MNNIIITILFMCNMLAMSSISWISLWVLMEITTYLFLTSSINQMNTKNKFEFLLTYFLVSFISSTIFLMSMLSQSNNMMNMLMENSNEENYELYQYILLSMTFLLKIGSIPFHPWVFSVMENIKWKTMLILSTIQKIIPIWALTFFSSHLLLMMIVSMSMILIMFIPLKTKSIYYFTAASATNNIIWILLSVLSSPITVLIYSCIYFILTINLILNFKKNNMKMLNQNFYSIGMLMSMFSLMGIPPLLGFIPKLNTIMSVIYSSETMMFLMIMLVISNSLTTIMYMKPIMSSMTIPLSSLNNKNILVKKNFMLSNMLHLSWPILIPAMYMLN